MRDLVTDEDGFSLLELLVALAVLSLAIVPMIGGQTSSLRNAGRLQDKQLAMMVAENVAVEKTVQAAPPVPGFDRDRERQGGIDFEWSSTTRRLPGRRVLMISIDVKKVGGADVLATLQTARSLK